VTIQVKFSVIITLQRSPLNTEPPFAPWTIPGSVLLTLSALAIDNRICLHWHSMALRNHVLDFSSRISFFSRRDIFCGVFVDKNDPNSKDLGNNAIDALAG